RFGTITFFDSYSNKSKIVTITQPGTVSFSVTPSNANFGATSPLSTQVNILGYQNWNITSKPSWITTTSSSGYGSASFQLIAQPNNGNPRSGTVSIFDNFTSRTQNITVNQASSLNPFSVTPSAPSYSSASGTTVQISVVSAGQWSVSNLPAWVYTNISSGIGNATVYAYANYNSGGPRSGIITFHDDYSSSNAFVTITQPGSNYFSVTPSSISFSAASPTNSTVNIYSNYGWSITSKPSWITPSYSSGYGNSSIQLYAQPNTGNVRSGTVTVYDTYNGNTQYISVNQASSIYGFSVTPSAPNYSSASGTSVQISVVSPGQWSATNYPSWISVNPSSGIGNTSVNAYAGYNSGLKRFGTITFYDNSTSSYAYVTITQPGYSNFNISPTSLQFGKGAVSKQLQITANGSWYVSSTPSWLSSDVSSGYGNAVINLLTSSNSGAVRYGTLVFYDYNSSSYVNANVSQDGVSSVFTVSPSNISFSSASPTSTSVNIVATGTWNITSIPNWIYTSTSSGKGQQSINIYAYSTSSSQPRKGTISIYDASNQSTNYLCVSQSNNSPIGTLTITALNQIREYGDPNNFNYTLSGFKNGDNSSI
ncbi:MAG: hypothetical protein K2Q22_11950, partial [Cytophagales bacterium]|nr:hypothetical protein [Cytophagales bacterium]